MRRSQESRDYVVYVVRIQSPECLAGRGSIAKVRKHMKIGDVVAYKEGTVGRALRSSIIEYPYAVVVSLDPFILISTDGDMMWRSTIRREDFEVRIHTIDEAHLRVLKRVVAELLRVEDELASALAEKDPISTYLPG